MRALFIGQTYIDLTFLTDRLPVGDEKHVARAYAISFGGNAVTAAFCCAKLSIVPDLAVRAESAFAVPPGRILDTSGAGDVFHGAYIYSHLADPRKKWEDHFRFAQAAAAHKIQHLGNEAGLPTLADIAAVRRTLAGVPA